MSTIQQFTINGVIDTNQSILSNLEKIASAAGAWLTYDINQGKWAVVINTTGSSTVSFDDSNIIGGINISSTGLTEVYNSVEVEFPHKDIKDRKDYITLTVAEEDRYPNEPDNKLTIKFDIVNEPIQAELLASRELKQSRIDKVIEFRADYSYMGLKAGELIDVTNEQYGFTNKVFRIIKVNEEDGENGEFQISITALEYDADVYDSTGLIRTEKSIVNGITAKNNNDSVQTSDDVDMGNQLVRLLAANAGAYLLKKLFDRVTGTNKFGPTTATGAEIDKILGNTKKPDLTLSETAHVCEGDTITIDIERSCSSCITDMPELEYDWTISGVDLDDISSISVNGSPYALKLAGKITIPASGTGCSVAITTKNTAGGATSKTLTFSCGGNTVETIIYNTLTYTYSTIASSSTITEGNNVTFTVNTTGISDGTSIPWEITGDGTSKVTSSLTGSLTINSNTANVVVTTAADSVYTGTTSITFTISPTVPDNPCHGTWDFTANVSILDSKTAPSTCSYVSVPVVWCGQFNGNDNQLEALTPLAYAMLPVPRAGEATVSVPTSVSVTKGNPSTVNITGSASVASSASVGGIPFSIITSFNSIGPLGLITGTTTSVYGYTT